jgi:hypothetical protein
LREYRWATQVPFCAAPSLLALIPERQKGGIAGAAWLKQKTTCIDANYLEYNPCLHFLEFGDTGAPTGSVQQYRPLAFDAGRTT